jgi:hypothetical protein
MSPELMSASLLRDLAILVAISIACCVAFLVEPDWNLQEAHLLCAGQPVQVFETMSACEVNMQPACPCVRPQNPWVIVYWLVLLAGIGVAAALWLRARSLPGALGLAAAWVVGGYGGMYFLSRRELFEPEAWAFAPYVFGAQAVIVITVFWLTRLTGHLVAKRRLRS